MTKYFEKFLKLFVNLINIINPHKSPKKNKLQIFLIKIVIKLRIKMNLIKIPHTFRKSSSSLPTEVEKKLSLYLQKKEENQLIRGDSK
jgi:hypothetical protein